MLAKRACTEWRKLIFCVPLLLFFPYMLSVLELHQQSTTQAMHPGKTTKFNHLMLGPAAGEGLPDRLQCRGNRALNRTHFSTFSNTSNSGDHISFVTVFTTYNSVDDRRADDMVTIGNTSYNKLERSLAIVNVFLDFIQVSMPRSRVIILTDPSANLPLHRTGLTIHPIQGEYSRDKLMLQRIRSYIAFLEKRLENRLEEASHYIFTDSDIAVVDDLGKIFDGWPNFHLALTFRNNREQPLNSGFIAVRGTPEGIQRGITFLQEVLQVYQSKFITSSRMLGDQLALAWVVRSHPSFDARRFTRRHAFLDQVAGASVLFLPCSVYNWTPPEGAGQFHGMPLDVMVVHFKGSRKRLMLESWNFFKSLPSSDKSDMLCLILRSGRTKYDF